MSNIKDGRWSAPENVLAERITVDDLSGYTSKKIVIDPGTRVLLVVGNEYYSDAPPNTYTMQNFMQMLGLQKPKPMTFVFTRSGKMLFQFHMDNLRTVEGLAVRVKLRIATEITDQAVFFRHLLGSQKVMTIEQLQNQLQPIIYQAVWDAVRMESIDNLTSAGAAERIDTLVARSANDSFRRYGLCFGDVHTMTICHDRFEANQNRKAEIWLYREELSQQEKLDRLNVQEELQKISQQEKMNDLEVLALHASTDRAEGKLAVIKRRIGIRKEWRDAILSDRFDSITSKEELSNLLAENDKAKVIRENEMDDLIRTFEENKAERDVIRKFVLQRIEKEQVYDLAMFDLEMNHALRIKKLEQEIELTKMSEDESTRQWRKVIEKERAEEMIRHEQRERELAGLKKEGTHDREEQWQNALNEKRIALIRGEIEDTRINREHRMKLLDLEIDHKAEDYRQGNLDREQDRKDRDRQGQLETLRILNEAHNERRRQDREHEEMMTRMETEFESKENDLIYSAQIKQFELMTAADVAKHEATQKAAIAQAEASMHSKEAQYEAVIREKEANEKKNIENSDKRAAAEREKVDIVMQATREAQEMHQKLMSQALDNMKPSAMNPTINVSTSGQTGMPEHNRSNFSGGAASQEESKKRVLLCPKCRAENTETSRYCERCGKHL